MPTIDLSASVGSCVAQHPQTSRVFEALKIDYCCGGGKSLEQACGDRKLDPQLVLQQLEQVISRGEQSAEDWLHASLADLCDNVEQTHHAYLKRELPRLTQMIAKVVNAHGASHPELFQLPPLFAALRNEMEPHMFKEEHVLFPAIRLLESSADAPAFPFGTIANPIRMMESEHDTAGDALAQIRKLTNDFAVPAGACNTYRATLAGLQELEADLHLHVHKENNILFPRAIELEGTRVTA
jgi:regulator of cell morphogenesis and NO signaling